MRNWTTQDQVLPFSVESFEINASLQNVPKTLKEFVCQYKNKKELTDKQECTHEERTKQSSKFGSFLNSFLIDICLFPPALVTMITMLVVIYMVCGQSKLKALVANIALQCAKGVEAADVKDMYCTCKTQWYIIGMLLIIMLGMTYLVTNKIKKSSLFKGCLFSNVTKVMLFCCVTQNSLIRIIGISI